MSFLLGDFKELNYNELVEINGGCAGITTNQLSLGIKTTIEKIINGGKTDNTPKGIPDPGRGASGSTNSGYSGSCSNKITTSVDGIYTKTISKSDDETVVNRINTSTASCSGANISYHSQLMFTDSDFNGGTKFSKTACGATSIINELSEQYSKETGKTLNDAQVVDAMKKAIDAGKIRGTDAFVKDWGGAAQIMGEAIGLKGKWTYTENAKDATAVILSIDTKTSERDYDGYHDHFVNVIGNGQYYDPYTNKIGYIKDLHLTSAWDADDGIKSAYRYIQYKPNK